MPSPKHASAIKFRPWIHLEAGKLMNQVHWLNDMVNLGVCVNLLELESTQVISKHTQLH